MATPSLYHIRLTEETVAILQDYDWEVRGSHWIHRHHPGWEVVITSQGWAVFDGQGKAKKSGYMADTAVLAKYLETLNIREVQRFCAMAA